MSYQTRGNEKNKDKHVTDKLQDSGIVDSGFDSGINLESTELSGDIDSSTKYETERGLKTTGEIIEYSEDIKSTVISEMRVDSGCDILSESMSRISFKQDSLNPLGRPGSRPTTEKSLSNEDSQPLPLKQEAEPWHLYYNQDNDGDTQLHIAIIQGTFEAAAFSLIRIAPHPCLLDIQNDEGQTPLHLAVLTRQPRIVRSLVLGGANLTVRNTRGNTALHLACSMGDLISAKSLTNRLDSTERKELGQHQTIPALPQNLEQKNYQGETCLHIAAARDHVELVRLLLQLGADLEAREGLSGKTVLHLAIERRCQLVVEFLLNECQPCLDARTYAGITAYQIAIYIDSKLANKLARLGATAEPLSETESDDSTDDDDDYIHNTPMEIRKHENSYMETAVIQ